VTQTYPYTVVDVFATDVRKFAGRLRGLRETEPSAPHWSVSVTHRFLRRGEKMEPPAGIEPVTCRFPPSRCGNAGLRVLVVGKPEYLAGTRRHLIFSGNVSSNGVSHRQSKTQIRAPPSQIEGHQVMSHAGRPFSYLGTVHSKEDPVVPPARSEPPLQGQPSGPGAEQVARG
jgi:hypothetical protein